MEGSLTQTMLDTFAHTEFPAAALASRLPGPVTVVIPTRNCAATIAATVGETGRLVEAGLVGQVLVVDADSGDGTAAVAREAGAEVVSENDLTPELGPVLGKGDAMWRSLAAVTGDVVVFVDGDVADFGSHYVTGLLGPLCGAPPAPGRPEATPKRFVKGTYRRPFRQSDGTELPRGGGRVTELTARPLLARLAPELAAFEQPLAGEVAAPRELLEQVGFATGYGVEIAMLVAMWDLLGIEGMAQVDLGTKRNAHQPLADLAGMAAEVIAALAGALDSVGRHDLGRIEAVAGTGPEPVVRPPWSAVRTGPSQGRVGR